MTKPIGIGAHARFGRCSNCAFARGDECRKHAPAVTPAPYTIDNFTAFPTKVFPYLRADAVPELPIQRLRAFPIIQPDDWCAEHVFATGQDARRALLAASLADRESMTDEAAMAEIVRRESEPAKPGTEQAAARAFEIGWRVYVKPIGHCGRILAYQHNAVKPYLIDLADGMAGPVGSNQQYFAEGEIALVPN